MPMMLGNSEWAEISVFHDDYKTEEEQNLFPIDDDYVREGYENGDDE